MKRYEFKAITSKNDVMMGLSLVAVFGFSILLIQLGLFYSGLDKTLKSHPVLLLLFIFLLLAVANVLFQKIKEKLVKHYSVELEETKIKIFENGNEMVQGQISGCYTKDNSSMSVKSLRADFYVDDSKISFRVRPKTYKTIQGSTSGNLFGTGSLSDIEELAPLCKDIKSVVGEGEDE
ncbi:hypothetical protein [Filifactor alocis]|uniref:hypothetical protein n=1 Tax=Filifactor alocis TaxID=143361 RepID=UPI003FA06F6B